MPYFVANSIIRPKTGSEAGRERSRLNSAPIGGHLALPRARAIENQVYLISSTYSPSEPDEMVSGIWNHHGDLLVSRDADWGKVFVAEVDLSRRTQWRGLATSRRGLDENASAVDFAIKAGGAICPTL